MGAGRLQGAQSSPRNFCNPCICTSPGSRCSPGQEGKSDCSSPRGRSAVQYYATPWRGVAWRGIPSSGVTAVPCHVVSRWSYFGLSLTWKHSQYFLRQCDFLHWHPLLCRTAPAPSVPPAQCSRSMCHTQWQATAEVTKVLVAFTRKGVLVRYASRAAWVALSVTITSALVDFRPKRVRVPLELQGNGRWVDGA